MQIYNKSNSLDYCFIRFAPNLKQIFYYLVN